MTLPSTFSRRKRLANSNGGDPFQYETIDYRVRQQIILIFDEANNAVRHPDWEKSLQSYRLIVQFLRKELGLQKLSHKTYEDEEFKAWFVAHGVIDEVVDAIECIFRVMVILRDNEYYEENKNRIGASIDEVNARLMEAAVGYQFESGKIIQVDSEFTHAELIVPALRLLSDPRFAGAEHEFQNAHRAFREGDYETALVEACKAFESTLKTIFELKNWEFDKNAALNKLLAVAFSRKLIPSILESEMSGLRAILEGGIGTVRNKAGGHGAGQRKRNVPKAIAAFQLNQTAAAIRLCVESARN